MSQKEIERRRDWQEEVYKNLEAITEEKVVSILGKKLTVLPGMFAPLWGDSLLLAKVVRKEIKKGDKVLDLGAGTGIQGIFAASKASSVLSVDINPKAIRCTKQNALKNHFNNKIKVLKSDLFSNVKSKFDLIIFNPPFRWFTPRDVLERGELDKNYKTLQNFFKQAGKHLIATGRILLVFSDSGDLKFLEQLIKKNDFKKEIMAKDKLNDWYYVVYRLTQN
jgi:release factor glutamine methyltransferase